MIYKKEQMMYLTVIYLLGQLPQVMPPIRTHMIPQYVASYITKPDTHCLQASVCLVS